MSADNRFTLRENHECLPDAPHVAVLLPAFNEGNSLRGELIFIAQVFSQYDVTYEVYIVDDGSTDESIRAAVRQATDSMMPVTIVQHRVNQGLGKALKTGIEHILKDSHADIVITRDADGTQDSTTMRDMIEKMRSGRHDVVVASRYVPLSRQEGVAAVRKCISIVGNGIFRMMIPYAGLTDYTSNYRAYRCQFLCRALEHYGDAFITQTGFASVPEMLVKLLPMKPSVAEVPFVLRYGMKQSPSKMRIGATIIATVRVIIGTCVSKRMEK